MSEETLRDWWPSPHQLTNPKELEQAFRETLRQLYELRNSHAALQEKIGKQSSQPVVTSTNTASISRLLGLPIDPSDTTQLADGTVLTYVAATRSFKFM
jgi:hypothetical protein